MDQDAFVASMAATFGIEGVTGCVDALVEVRSVAVVVCLFLQASRYSHGLMRGALMVHCIAAGKRLCHLELPRH